MAITVPFRVEIREDAASVARIQNDFRRMGREADRANQRADRGLRQTDASANRLRNSLALVAGAYAALRGAISSINLVADFEEQLAFGAAVSGAQNINNLGRELRDIAQVSRFTALQVSGAFSFLAQTGFTEAQSLQALPDTLNLAQIGLIDVQVAADLASNTLKGFGLEVSDLSRITDVFAAAVTSSNTNVRQLGDAMSYVAPTARALDLSVESTAAAISVLSDAGVQGERAGTALRRILIELNDAGVDVSNGIAPALEELAQGGFTLEEATDLVGKRFSGFLKLLVDGRSDVQRFTADFKSAEGAARDLAERMSQNLRFSIDLAKSAFQELILTLADFLPLREVFDGIAASLNFISRNAGGIVGVGSFFGAAPAAAGAYNFLGPLIGSFIGSLFGTGRANIFRGFANDVRDVFRSVIGDLTGGARDLRSAIATGSGLFDNDPGLIAVRDRRSRAQDLLRSRSAYLQDDSDPGIIALQSEIDRENRNEERLLRSRRRVLTTGLLSAGAQGVLGVGTAIGSLFQLLRAAIVPVTGILAILTGSLIAFNAELRRSDNENIANIGTSYGAFGRTLVDFFSLGASQIGRSTTNFFNLIFGTAFENFPELLDSTLTGVIDIFITFIDEMARLIAGMSAYVGTFLSPQSRIDANDAFFREQEAVLQTRNRAIRHQSQVTSLIDRRNYFRDVLLPQAPDDVSRQGYQNQINTLNTQILTRFFQDPGFQRYIDNINRTTNPFGPYGPQAQNVRDRDPVNAYERYIRSIDARAQILLERGLRLTDNGRLTALTTGDVGLFPGPIDRHNLASQEAYLVGRDLGGFPGAYRSPRDFGTPFRDRYRYNRGILDAEDRDNPALFSTLELTDPSRVRHRRDPLQRFPSPRVRPLPGEYGTDDERTYRDVIAEINRELDDRQNTIRETAGQYEVEQRIREAILDIERQGLDVDEFRAALLQKRIDLQRQQVRELYTELADGATSEISGALANELNSYLSYDTEAKQRFRFSWSEFGEEAAESFIDSFVDRVEEGFENLFEYLRILVQDYFDDTRESNTPFSFGGALGAFFGVDPRGEDDNGDLPFVDTRNLVPTTEGNLIRTPTPRPNNAPGLVINQGDVTINGGDPVQIQRILANERRETIRQVEGVQSRNLRLGK